MSVLLLSMHRSALRTYLVLLPLIVIVDGLLLWWLINTYGWNADAAQLFTRYTARVACLVFLPAFVASSLHILARTPVTASLLQRRRQWGLSFAFAHTLHMAAIIANYQVRGDWFTADDIPALVIYFFILLMVLTSNGWSVRQLRRGWKVLHKVGMYGIFIGFAVTYVGRLRGYQVALSPSEPTHEWYLVYLVLSVLVLGALGLRIIAFWQSRGRQGGS